MVANKEQNQIPADAEDTEVDFMEIRYLFSL